MTKQEIYIARLYRVCPGDVDIKDVPMFQGEDLEANLTERLLSYFNDPRLRGREKPHHANLTAADGTVLLELMVVNGRVQRVPEGPAELD